MIEKILIVDDEDIMREFLSKALSRKGYEITVVKNVKEAFKALGKETFDLVLTDMKLPDGMGIDVVRRTKELSSQTGVIVMTAYGTVENAVEAMQLGAYNYILKPFTLEILLATIKKVEEHLALIHENLYHRESSGGSSAMRLIAESPAMRTILSEIKEIAKSNASVFIHGESGTGKEVISNAIHSHSLRALGPYIRVNCAAIPETLLESEFFGHEKGAFTGANNKRMGRFELADKGTLLLDEVTEIPILLQPKLLRVIQEKEFERVGGTRTNLVDVRFISTSNRDLKEAINNQILREDLYYRLNVIPLYIPPLRDRKEDILPLANYYIEKFCIDNHKPLKTFSKESMKALEAYKWPGNIRELSNVMERVVVRNTPKILTPLHLDI